MAVTAPTPPTPPTPPSVPAVTLGGGGSVTESTTPVSGYQSDADRQEAQARQAVARGDGPLAKTTQEQPAAKQGQQSGSQHLVEVAVNGPCRSSTDMILLIGQSGCQGIGTLAQRQQGQGLVGGKADVGVAR